MTFFRIVRRFSLATLTAALFLLPTHLLAATSAGTTLPNPLGTTGSIEDLLINVSRGLIGLVALVATFMFIYGGIMMLTSGGNEKQVEKSKEVLKWTAISIVIIVFSAAIIQFVLNSIGADSSTVGTVPGQSLGLGTNLQNSVLQTVRFILGLLGIIGVIMMIYGGYMWLTAAGNEEKVEKGTAIIRAAVIGILIILFSWIVVSYIINSSVTVSEDQQNAPPPTSSVDVV